MITYVEGDLFTSPAQVIVNAVNTDGVMGKGIALEYKKRYPKMFDQYRMYCDKNQLEIGKLMIWHASDYWVLLFPTKKHWRNPSKLEYIEKGLIKFVNTYAEKHIVSIAFPRLGCGNGELNWDAVKPLMEKYLQPLPIDVFIYLKNDKTNNEPEHKNPSETVQ
jgi:O-acetyl-ADP-ribose deacetylase (regulator of RNase III)